MRERRDGAIIYIISVAAVRATTVLGMYGVTKAADYALCRNLAAEWGPDNVRVNCIAPGLVKTEFARVLYEDPQRRAAQDEAGQRGVLQAAHRGEDAQGVGGIGAVAFQGVVDYRDLPLPGGVVDAGDPAASIRVVFSWSVRQLSDQAARMFRLLSLHPGPDITVPAAAGLAALADADTRRLLRELAG